MRPKQVHNWSYSKKTKGYIIVFDEHIIKEAFLEFSENTFFDISDEHAQLLKPLIENLIEESNQNDTLSEQTISQGIGYLLLQLKRLSSNSSQSESKKSTTVLKFSELVSNTICQNLSVKDYADKLHITVGKLNDICKEQYGKSPKTIILEKKITEAKRLLYFTDMSIKEIAFQLGFDDSSYFSRIFKQRTKLSPTVFKNT